MLRDNFLREELCDSEAAQRDHYPVIAISHYRNEIRQQVDGAQTHKQLHRWRVPAHATVYDGQLV